MIHGRRRRPTAVFKPTAMRGQRPALIRTAVLACGLGAALLAACAAPPENAQSEVLNADPGRSAFSPVPLPAAGTTGGDPLALSQNLYGMSGPVEGNYSESVELLSKTADQQVVLFTQVGLPDDSVRGQRHRLEFLPEGADWALTWAGRQVQCWPGRGHEDWGTAPCR